MENVIEQCALYEQKYEDIREQFFAFHKAVSLIHFHGKMRSLSVQHLRPDDRFYVNFIGKEYLIHYDFHTRGNNAGIGFFVSYLVDQVRTDGSISPQPIQQVEVDRSGNARVKGHKDGYPWHCDADGLTILLTLLT